MLAELERRELRDNTLVIFLSDNGARFPREKGALYDSGTRTPLVFSWPRHIRAGSVYERGLVSTIDLAPTILELAGVTRPETSQGIASEQCSPSPFVPCRLPDAGRKHRPYHWGAVQQ